VRVKKDEIIKKREEENKRLIDKNASGSNKLLQRQITHGFGDFFQEKLLNLKQ
jgi:hypothetical protein